MKITHERREWIETALAACAVLIGITLLVERCSVSISIDSKPAEAEVSE